MTLRRSCRVALAMVALGGMVWLSTPKAAASGPSSGPTAYVTNNQLNTVSVFSGTHLSGTIKVGAGPAGIAVTPNGHRAYVADFGFLDEPSRTITPVDLTDHKAGTPITVGTGPLAIAITPNGHDALVTLEGTSTHPGHQVVEVDLHTHAVSAPIDVGANPESLAITPDGAIAYVADLGSAEVTPVDLEVWPPHAETPIHLPGTAPRAIAISPSGKTAYVLDAEGATVIPVSLAHRTVGTPVDLGCQAEGDSGCTPDAIIIGHDGRTAYVAAAGSSDVIMLALPSLTVAGVLETGGYPDALGLGCGWLFVADGASNAMTIFSGLSVPATVPGVTYPFGVAVVTHTRTAPPPVRALPVPPGPTVARHRLPAGFSPPVRPFYGLPRA